MLDVDYLLCGGKGVLKSVVMYEVGSGYFKGGVLDLLRGKVEGCGVEFREVDYGDFRGSVRGVSLWGEVCMVVDMDELVRVHIKDGVVWLRELVLGLLGGGVSGRYVFLWRGGEGGVLGELLGGEDWKGLRRGALVLEGVKLVKGNVGRLVDYFVGRFGCGVGNVGDLVLAMQGLLEGKDYGLVDFARDIDLVLCVCVVGGVFDVQGFRNLFPVGGGKEDYFRFHRIIYRMCLQRDSGGVDSFIREIGMQLNVQNRDVRVVLGGVNRVLREVICANELLSSKEDMERAGWGGYKVSQLVGGVGGGNVSLLQNFLKFQTLLSMYEPELNGVSPLVAYKQLGNLFLD